MDVAGMSPKLSVTATLDADSGRFAIYIFAAHPLSEYKDWRSVKDTITAEGEIRLYEDGTKILTVPGPFDLLPLMMKYFYERSGYNYFTTGLPLKTGSTYRLEVEMEGYPMAWATGVMPEAPITNDAKLDTTQRIYYGNAAIPPGYYNFATGSDSDYSFPFDLIITVNNAKTNNYYYIQQRTYLQIKCDPDDYTLPLGFEFNDYRYPIGVTDFSIIQNQPEYWTGAYEFGDGAYDLYLIDHLMLTNQTFSEKSINLSLFLPSLIYRHTGMNAPIPDYEHEYGVECHVVYRHDLLVRHISEETYKNYMNMILQSKDIDFFTEPVNIPGNIQNGYGCFSVSNTKRFNLLNFERYRYFECLFKGYETENP